PLLEAGDLILELGPGPFRGGVLVDRFLQAGGELGEVGIELLGVVAAPHPPKRRRPLPIVLAGRWVWLICAHGHPSIHDAHNPPLASRQQDRISGTYGANRRNQPTVCPPPLGCCS